MLKTLKNNKAFTLVETLIAILITAFVSGAILLGITQNSLYLESVILEETVHQRLKQETETIKGMLMAGTSPDLLTYGSGGGQDIEFEYSSRTEPMKAKLYTSIQRADESLESAFSIYYDIETMIIWQNQHRYFFDKLSDVDYQDTLKFKLHQVKLNL